jgi:hypothetical protein
MVPLMTGVPEAAGDGEGEAASARGVSAAAVNASTAAKKATVTSQCRVCIGEDLSVGTAAGGRGGHPRRSRPDIITLRLAAAAVVRLLLHG